MPIRPIPLPVRGPSASSSTVDPAPRLNHGVVLQQTDLDYSDMRNIGRVTITYDRRSGVMIEVTDFGFDSEVSRRQEVTKAMAWARDVLDNAVRADALVPGGEIRSVSAREPR